MADTQLSDNLHDTQANNRVGANVAAMFLVAVIVALVASMYPGNIGWLIDEPQLIQHALDANASGTLATSGLRGSLGHTYGPLAVQFYQLLLRVTGDDLLMVVRSKAFTNVLVFSICCMWIARRCGAPMVAGLIVVVAPGVWEMNRLLWDNPLLLPLSAVSVCAFDRLQQDRHNSTRVLRKLFWSTTLGVTWVLMMLLHFMALPLIAAMGAMVAHQIVARDRLRSNMRALLVCVVGFVISLVVTFPLWIGYARLMLIADVTNAVLEAGAPVEWPVTPRARWPESEMSPLAPVLAPLLGLAPVTRGLPIAFTILLYTFVAVGVYRAFVMPVESPTRRLAILAGLTVFAQAVMFRVMLREWHPHYFHATLPVFAVFLFLAIAAIKINAARLVVVGVLVGSLSAITASKQLEIHRSQITGDPGHVQGPTLGRSIGLSRQISSAGVRFIDTEFLSQALNPLTLIVPIRAAKFAYDPSEITLVGPVAKIGQTRPDQIESNDLKFATIAGGGSRGVFRIDLAASWELNQQRNVVKIK